MDIKPEHLSAGAHVASLESIVFTPHRCSLVGTEADWAPVRLGTVIHGFPQIVWKDNTPWREANLWALERATGEGANIKTVQATMTALHAYARWLEETGTDWRHFPPRKADRCLVRFRRALVEARNAGEIAPSTASQRMAAVVRFYRWIYASNLFSPEWPMWDERRFSLQTVDQVGLTRTITVNTTDLAIPNRKAPGDRLEDGLLPVSSADRSAILDYVQKNGSEELFLLLACGFYTGMRLGTITDIRINSLERAVPDPAAPGLFRLAVGPGADPPIHTKFGVTGQVWITNDLLEELRRYAFSVRRLKRQSKADDEDRTLLFLTRFGKPYAQRATDKSPAINVEMFALRKAATSLGIAALKHFHFHQTRCTFATELARVAISTCGAIGAIAIVKEALLHRHEATALKYIRFVEKTPAKEAAANDFTREFLALVSRRECNSDD